MPNPCAIVIFGASGDLAKRKLLPALYELALQKLLDDKSYIIGFSRSQMTDEAFRAEAKDAISKYARTKPFDEKVWKALEPRLFYIAADYGADEGHAKLTAKMGELDKQFGTGGNRMYYISTPPATFEPIITGVGKQLAIGRRQSDKPTEATPAAAVHGGWKRIIIEKPFGTDLTSAKALNALLLRNFKEDQVFRIDHYLGKETVQNLMVLRFANSIFEPIWNYKYIDHVQITVGETLGVEKRGGYYDKSGALRDMVQNHLFQLMALVAMEPPAGLDATNIRDEKVKVFRSVRPFDADHLDGQVVRGQYGPGPTGKTTTPGYTHEEGVPADSQTETFVALKLFIDNWRWSGTPFYLRTGKALPEKLSEVVVRFRSPPLTLFQKSCQTPVRPNDLVIRVQPEEGITWRFNAKVPGGAMNIQPVNMDMQYKDTFKVEAPEAYERLIADAIAGDQTLFIRGDEAEAAWTVVDPIGRGWASGKAAPPQEYTPGTWGAAKATEMMQNDGRQWATDAPASAATVTACAT
jgi:glucose-6-phosphate 1-dehydrogenase